MFKNIAKTFLIVPIVAYPFLGYLFSEPFETDLTKALRLQVFWQGTSENGFTNVVVIIGSLVYMLVFHLLFGTYISRHFMYMPSYFFARIYSRRRWLLRQSLYLSFYVLWYIFLFMACSLIGCDLVTLGEPDAETYRTFWIMYAACASLLLFTTFLINFGIILWKSAVGFAGCWILLIFLSALAGFYTENGPLVFLNPLSYATLFDMPMSYVVAKMAYQFLLSAALVLAACRYLKTYDITLREVD